MSNDPVVAEIRRIREEIAARFNFDIEAIGKYARERDAAENGKVIRLPPRRPEGYPAKPHEPAEIASHSLSPLLPERFVND